MNKHTNGLLLSASNFYLLVNHFTLVYSIVFRILLQLLFLLLTNQFKFFINFSYKWNKWDIFAIHNFVIFSKKKMTRTDCLQAQDKSLDLNHWFYVANSNFYFNDNDLFKNEFVLMYKFTSYTTSILLIMKYSNWINLIINAITIDYW